MIKTRKALGKKAVKSLPKYYNDLSLSETETTFELNFAVLKFKHTVKKKKDGK